MQWWRPMMLLVCSISSLPQVRTPAHVHVHVHPQIIFSQSLHLFPVLSIRIFYFTSIRYSTAFNTPLLLSVGKKLQYRSLHCFSSFSFFSSLHRTAAYQFVNPCIHQSVHQYFNMFSHINHSFTQILFSNNLHDH